MSLESLTSMEWFQTLRNDIWDSVILHVFIVIFVSGLVNFMAQRFLKRLRTDVAAKTENPWDDALLDALPAPLAVFIWVLGLFIATRLIGGPVFGHPYASDFYVIVVIINTCWFLNRWIGRIEEELIKLNPKKKEDERLDPTTIHAVGKLMRLSAIITAILVSLSYLNINISAVLTFGGIGGIAIGFAAKDLLANFFGGLTIYLDQPFKVGDWVRSPDRNIEGTVEYIGWRHTRIRTFDKRPLYVPNSVFTTIVIENPQRMLNRRIYETIGIRYDDISKMSDITRDVEKMLREHPEIDTSQTLMVYFNAFAPSSCDFFVYTFTKTTKWAYFHEVKHDILLRIAGIIEGHGAEIAFPTSTLHIASAPGPDETGAIHAGARSGEGMIGAGTRPDDG